MYTCEPEVLQRHLVLGVGLELLLQLLLLLRRGVSKRGGGYC